MNKISLGGRGEILLALPRDATVRTANALRKPASELCPGNTMCAWKNSWYTGDKISMWACYNYRIPWLGNGSWINNQSTGTVANFLDDYGVSKWHDDGAFSLIRTLPGIGCTGSRTADRTPAKTHPAYERQHSA
ncbi:hypothetical protein [Streptomyces sp. NPDC052192]|uniref:hypothetical protein n=1 Tax=Streptomyces sp. NPDC052192 TaxID=3155052 RepID=UPI003432B730